MTIFYRTEEPTLTMKNYTYLLVLMLFSTIADAKIATVKGKITSPRERTVSLSMYADLITFEPMQYNVTLNSDNTFSIDVQIFEATVATLTHANSSIEVFIEADDDLLIEFHGWDLEATALFSGKGGENNYYLNKASERFKRLSDEHITYQMSHLNPDDFKTYMDC